MTLARLISASLGFHRRIHAAVALGVIIATAVLTGALVVGDSMRGSLRHLTLDRLERIDELLLVDRFFRTEVANELAASPEFQRSGYDLSAAVVLLPSTSLENQSGDGARASGVTTLSATADFAKFSSKDFPTPGNEEIVLNAPLADELGAKVGDTLILRLPASEQVPADSPLGRKENLTHSVPELKVVAVIPAEGLGRFSLRPNQALPRNAYVSLETLQNALERPGRANALLVGTSNVNESNSAAAHEALTAALHSTLSDLGLSLRRIERSWRGKTVYQYLELTSDRMLLEPAVVKSAQAAFGKYRPQVLMTYLANRIQRVDDPQHKPISYSTVCAVDSNAALGPALDEKGDIIGPLGDDEIVVNDWAAKDQVLSVGDQIELVYFEPESSHGDAKERKAVFTVRGIAPLTRGTAATEQDRQPTFASDPHLTPEVKGVTDAESIAKWDAPFKVDYSLVRPEDDKYWEQYRTTPKAFISLASGQKLWGSRWGDATAVRWSADEESTVSQAEQQLLKQLRSDGVTLGFEFQPIKARDMAAASGTTPFDALFLGLSMFIVGSAVLLIVLLFRLGVDQRASQIGVLLGLGWTRARVQLSLLTEGTAVACVAALVGVAAGVGYAWLMLVGLRTWWLGAIATPFLQLYVTPRSLAIGYAAGLVLSVLSIWWGLRQMRHVAIRTLLAGQATSTTFAPARSSPWTYIASIVLLLAAVGLALAATRLQADVQAGAFLGSGAAVLAAVLLLVRRQLRFGGEAVSLMGAAPLARLALRSAARNPARSTLTLALVAAASFLIVALSAFRLSPSSSGGGGFPYIAESAQPIVADLNDPADRNDLLADDAPLFEAGAILSLRLQPGDDASCRNLFQSTQPRVLGVPQEMITYYDDPKHTPFEWSATAATSADERANPWRLLRGNHEPYEPVPVILDQNTAMYSLQLYYGVGEEFTRVYPGGQEIRFRVVGLLSNSVLQGSLLVGEAAFKRLFPQISGYRYFLVKPSEGRESQGAAAIENRLSDQGFDCQRTADVLADLMAVQNTYLSSFQALGAMGLLLGTLGLAAVQVRSVLERRAELGLLRAEGFTRSRLTQLVMLENLVLLLGGLAIGICAALIAVLPHAFVGGARPPWLELAIMLAIVSVCGCLFGWLVLRSMLRAPVVAALRGE